MNSTLLDAALDYAAAGWHVFPLSPGAKIPLPESHGVLDATTDPEQIRAWWAKTPAANIGVNCGRSNLVVVDLDMKDDRNGLASWDVLCREHGLELTTLAATTPSGGRHLFFHYAGTDISNSANKLGPGVDIRAGNGYVLIAPSEVGGKPYGWSHAADDGIAPLPSVLVQLLTEPRPQPAPVITGPPHHAGVSPYGQAALVGELARLAQAQEGERNDMLNRCAFALGQLVAGGELAQTEVEDTLLATAMDRGLPQREAEKTIASGLKAGMAQPRTAPEEVRRMPRETPEAAEAGETPQAGELPATETPKGAINLTDLGNARRLVRRHGADLHYCYAQGRWLAWDGRRWRENDTGEVQRQAKETVTSIYAAAADEPDEAARKALAKWAMSSESRNRLDSMIALAQSEPGVPVRPTDLDANPWLLNCLNGTIDLRTGELREHRREDLITKLAPVEYDPAARLDLWDTFLAEATGGDRELAAFLQRAAGHSLSGDTSEDILFFVYGPTKAGKSTFLEALKETLGDYAVSADFETFLQRNFIGGPRNDIARLAGARFVVSIEVDEGKRLAEGLIKTLTGGDTIAARFLYKEAFEYHPAFKLWLAANHAPKVRDDDEAMWERILTVPFEHTVPRDKRDPQVKATLRTPAFAGPAILAWAVQGCLIWQREGLGVPPAVERATKAYRDAMNPLKDFFTECCVFGPTLWAATADLRRVYDEWCKERGDRLVNGNRFAEKLKAHGCESTRNTKGNKRGWLGIGLIASSDTSDTSDSTFSKVGSCPQSIEDFSKNGVSGVSGVRDCPYCEGPLTPLEGDLAQCGICDRVFDFSRVCEVPA